MYPATSHKALVLFSLAATSLYGDALETRVDALESRMAAIKTETVKNTQGAQMAMASPLYDGYSLFATADLLYWRMKEGGSDYALVLKNPTTQTGKAKHAHFDWDFGFRVGAGYVFEHDAWDATLGYTWFWTEASDSAHAPKGGALSPQKGLFLTNNATKMHSHWDVHYSVIDLELGRRYFVSKYLAFRPQFGIETAWIHQNRNYKVTATESGLPLELTTYGKNDFWGIGPRAGFEGTWYFGRHWNLFGMLNGSVLWGHFDDTSREQQISGGLKSTLANVKDTFRRLAPNTQVQLGFGWESNLAEDRYHLGIKLGYEFQYWWRQNQFLNSQQFSSYNFEHESMDLSLNGATLDIRFDF